MEKPNKWDKQHLRNLGLTEKQITQIYESAVKEAAAIGVSITDFNPDKPFSFSDYPQTKARIDKLIKTLTKDVQTVIVNGVRSGWTLSNNKNNALCDYVFGDNKYKLTKAQERKYYSNNDKAREAFEARKTAGLNLSDRVWNYTNQFKTEIEFGIDLDLRDGSSAAEMARNLKQYLKYPDKLFRRVRDEHGQLQLSQAAKNFHPGQGVYRSSYKNAMRLARTETNMAYRTSDYTRWQQLDFVVGIEIRLSNNHTLNGVPFTDICDDLKGKYPKDFKFTGWHPACRCHAISILKTEEEMEADSDRIMNGEEPTDNSVNAVKDVPENFKKWVDANKDRIERAEQRGTLPYFIRDNKDATTKSMKAAKKVSDWDANLQLIESKLGVKRGKEMTFEEANDLKGNPLYGTNNGYSINCQSSVVANELRRRGFDVQAQKNTGKGSIPHKLSTNTELAWIDPQTGKTPSSKTAGGFYFENYKMKNKTVKVVNLEFNELTKETGRYHMKMVWKTSYGSGGHIVTAERLTDGTLRIYDPQTGELVNWLGDWSKKIKLTYGLKVLRVDTLYVNTDIINGVVLKSK
jgi:hypothetical protein